MRQSQVLHLGIAISLAQAMRPVPNRRSHTGKDTWNPDTHNEFIRRTTQSQRAVDRWAAWSASHHYPTAG